MSYDFNTTYALDPWDTIESNERPWYDGHLREVYARQSVYSQRVSMQVDLTAMRSRTITFNSILPTRPNISSIPNREMNASRLYMDGYQKRLTVQRYGNGMSLHRESQMFNYWHRNGDYGLIPIINGALGQAIVDHTDILARNTYLTNRYAMFGTGSATGFGGIKDNDVVSTELLDAIWLGMRDRRVPWAAYPVPFASDGEIICITSPGVIYDLKREGENYNDSRLSFVNSSMYQGKVNLLNGEVGMYRGVRFVDSGLSILWNAGEVHQQTTITAAVKLGDGAPDPANDAPVDDVRYVGQEDATHYIQVASVSGFERGQKVTVHRTRHSDGSNPRGVVGGLDWTDPQAQDMIIESIDVGNNRLTFQEPYMMANLSGKGLESDLGGGVYGYVTLGTNIHTALFLHTGWSNGVVAGVAQPPTLYFPPATDDYLSMYRITYDMWLKYALWEPQVFEVAFLSGSNKDKGNVYRRANSSGGG